ncbi:prophage antirepressor [Gluconobacter frateurii NBRC 103465]|nr:prophage antirepressor [Gluconobacter frateurii NBRC 103465]
MTDLVPFSFESHDVRVVMRDGQPWWMLADVCEVLELTNTRNPAARLDEDEKGVHTMDTLGGPQEVTVINESGLYSLIFTSRKAAAKRFKKWVTSEVLPAIRATGRYATPVSRQEWFNRFARVLALWDALGEAAALQEWQKSGLDFPMPRKQGVRAMLEATMDVKIAKISGATERVITSRHNGSLGGRPRKGESAEQARHRRFHMVDREVIPFEDGESTTVITYSDQTREGL